ncbi:hypothetical protein HT585_21170 [Ensifer sp. HO-A22]|uniref:Uncharacterized protein n=1 Tax=Ensifer oleiphilus TaxID=2742698 RepID=A0A7Y6UPS7_9HYPH|nr:hypothetical protein [Ensifer oleiphilus]NVD41384.1 hypothetical protein [Ensifer oleiphilus]
MKIIIVALASLAFASSAFAAAPSAPVENSALAKAKNEIELAAGRSRDLQISTSGNRINAPSPASKKSRS